MRGPHCLPQVSFPLIYSLGIAQQELSLKDTVKVRSGKTYVGLFNMVTRSTTWHENKEEFSAGKSLILVFLFIRLMNVLLCLNPDKSFHDSSCLQLTSLQLTYGQQFINGSWQYSKTAHLKTHCCPYSGMEKSWNIPIFQII